MRTELNPPSENKSWICPYWMYIHMKDVMRTTKKNERFNWLSLLNFNLSIDIHFLSFNQIYSNIILFLLKDEMTIIL